MKSEILAQPKREIDPVEVMCCSYTFFSYSTPPPNRLRLQKAKLPKKHVTIERIKSAKVAAVK